MSKDFARDTFKLWRTQVRREVREQKDETRTKNEDPLAITNILNEFIGVRDWSKGLAEGTLFTEWASLVGVEIASRATPVSLVDGRLTIQTTSTAWATQLNLIKDDLLAKISSSAPGALVEELTIIGPHAPSWKRGLRTIRGAQGPRDTYG